MDKTLEDRPVVVPHHEHDPAVAHHFDDLEQQHDTNVLGMWVFLVTEVMLFGGMFLAYTAYHAAYPLAFDQASLHQNLVAGTINTCVLIISSLMMALAIRNAHLGNRRGLVLLLAITAVLGLVFLGIKGFEYYQHWEEHLVPGLNYAYTGPDADHAALFFFLYFAMTGTHAIHLTIGVVLVLIVMFRAMRGAFLGEAHFTGVEVLGLYWHFVDVIWLFLFPLFYLIAVR